MNPYIETWKNIVNSLILARQVIYESNKTEYTISKKIDDIREYASRQLKILDETRPNKDISMYKQANEQQKEYIDYLEKVIVYGNLEGKDNVN